MTADPRDRPDHERELDAFLDDMRALDDSESAELKSQPAGLGLLQLSEALEPSTAPASLRARLLAELPVTRRFERFAASVAKLLDIGLERANALLDRLDDAAVFTTEMPGVEFFWVEGGPRVANAVRGFLRVAAGTTFPEHEHLGEETVLVLQGAFTEPGSGRTVRAGETDVLSAQSSHTFHAPPDGPDLLMLQVTAVGVRVGEHTYLPR